RSLCVVFFFSSRRRHTRSKRDWSSDVCSSDLTTHQVKNFNGIPLSVLDLAPVNEGGNPRQSFQNSADLAQHVERLGFHRYWLARSEERRVGKECRYRRWT